MENYDLPIGTWLNDQYYVDSFMCKLNGTQIFSGMNSKMLKTYALMMLKDQKEKDDLITERAKQIRQEEGYDLVWYNKGWVQVTPLRKDFVLLADCVNLVTQPGGFHFVMMGLLNEIKRMHASTGIWQVIVDPQNVVLYKSEDNTPLVGFWNYGISVLDINPELQLNPWFRANETFGAGEYDKVRALVFSLGCMMFYLLTGGGIPWIENADFTKGEYDIHREKPLNWLNMYGDEVSINPELKTFVERCLNDDPMERLSVDKIIDVLTYSSLANEEGNANFLQSFFRTYDVDDVVYEGNGQVTKQEEHNTSYESPIQGQLTPNLEFVTAEPNAKGFADVAGMSSLKTQLQREVLFVIQNPGLALLYRLKPLNGMLLYGPPGCGKTFISQKFAEESDCKFALVKGSDLADIYVHGSQSLIGNLFKQAEKNAPCVIVLDEIDALIPNRKDMADSRCMCQEVNEFLTQLNNCGERGIFVIGSTNRPELIDPAVLRSGRLEKHIYVPLPDENARRELFQGALLNRPQEEDINLDDLVRRTEGYVSSDINLIVNQAALTAAIARKPITQKNLLEQLTYVHRSVSEKDAQEYEEMHQRMETGKVVQKIHPVIGFNTVSQQQGRTPSFVALKE